MTRRPYLCPTCQQRDCPKAGDHRKRCARNHAGRCAQPGCSGFGTIHQ